MVHKQSFRQKSVRKIRISSSVLYIQYEDHPTNKTICKQCRPRSDCSFRVYTGFNSTHYLKKQLHKSKLLHPTPTLPPKKKKKKKKWNKVFENLEHLPHCIVNIKTIPLIRPFLIVLKVVLLEAIYCIL